MSDQNRIESTFWKVLADLRTYLTELTLVGGWAPYIYSKFLWNIPSAKLITTTDIDFGFGGIKAKNHRQTIFETLSPLDYTERHLEIDRIYPVVLYKAGEIPIDFITTPSTSSNLIERLIGPQININKIEYFDFLLNNRMSLNISNQKDNLTIYIPKPSAFLYHKGAIFNERENKQKQAKDLHYMYFILRYSPDIRAVYNEIIEYKKQGYFKKTAFYIHKYFSNLTSEGCLMVEEENGPDSYIRNLRQDIFERFNQLLDKL